MLTLRRPTIIDNNRKNSNSIMSHDPFRLFDDFFQTPLWSDSFWNEPLIRTRTDRTVQYKKTEKGIEVLFMTPGYGKDDLELTFDQGILTLTDKLKKNQKSHELTQSIRISDDIDEKSVVSHCKNGVVTVTANFVEPKSTKRIIKIE